MKFKLSLSKKIVIVFIAFLGIAATTVDTNKYFEISKNIEIFANLYKELNTYYVDELDPGKVMKIGLDAMLNALDPFTNYISENEIESFRFVTDGKYNGVGAVFKQIGDYVTIMDPVEGSPAQKAGLISGDQVLEIDGKSVKNKNGDEVNDLLRGFPGTEVILTIKRFGTPKTLEIKLVRDEINIPNVPYHAMLNKDVGYIALTTFTRDAGKNVADALLDLREKNPDIKGLVFDLRDNGGGLLAEGVNVTNVFVPRGELVVSTKGKVEEWNRSFKTLNNPIDTDIPVVVLINENTASASEIVSGSLQDLDRAVVMGQLSYGKGLVQNVKDIGYNAKLKLTTAKYYIPSGRCIQALQYDKGEPVHIPDSLRTPFKTRAGRTVLDGGGIKPDRAIPKKKYTEFVKNLQSQYIIFDYVTEYMAKKPKIDSIADFHFNDFADFSKYTQQRKFSYKTETENTLAQLKKNSDNESYLKLIDADIKSMESKIQLEKIKDLEANKVDLIDLLEKEIISRVYYDKGKIQIGLRNDQEVVEALKLLSNPDEYKKILKK